MQLNQFDPLLKKFQELQTKQAQKKDHLDFEPEMLCKIYEELQKQNILLTSFLGKGAEGVIFEAKKDNQSIVVKCISKPIKEDILMEQQIIKSIGDIPQVVKFIDGFYLFNGMKYFQLFKKYSCNVYLDQQIQIKINIFKKGDMKNILTKLFTQRETFSLNSIIAFALQMTTCLEVLDNNKIFHSDFKPQNILYDSETKSFKLDEEQINTILILGDFGMSLKIQSLEKSFTENVNIKNNLKLLSFQLILPKIQQNIVQRFQLEIHFSRNDVKLVK